MWIKLKDGTLLNSDTIRMIWMEKDDDYSIICDDYVLYSNSDEKNVKKVFDKLINQLDIMEMWWLV